VSRKGEKEMARPEVYGQAESPLAQNGPMGDYVDFVKKFMGFIRGAAISFAGPLEMILRPRFATQYFNMANLIILYMVFNLWWLLSELLKLSRLGVPAMHAHAPIGMGIVAIAFYVGCIYHAWRLRPLVLDMRLEQDSEVEGKELPIYAWLPKSSSWAWVRIVYEPATVLIAAVALYVTHLADLTVLVYLLLAAFALFVNACVTWYTGWVIVRTLLDNMHRAKLLSEIGEGKQEFPRSIGRLVLSGIPTSLPMKERTSVAARIAGVERLPAELESLISNREGALA
jgi:hypothetical protein